MSEFRLSIELVPATCWYKNLRKNMAKPDWDKLRRQIYADYGHKCAICGDTKSQLNCHEIWDYDDNNHIQILKGFVALCQMCHHVKHIGNAGILADQGYLDFGAVVSHFLKVNGCTKSDFEKYQIEAFQTWRQRSQLQWRVDLGPYASLIAKEEE